MQQPFQTSAVSAAFDDMQDNHRAGLLAIRTLIFEQAHALPVGRIEETLKWGQPSYATPDTKAGTPIRLGTTKSGHLAVFTHCQTTVMSDYRALAPPEMKFDGNRAVHLSPDMPIPLAEITPLIRAALTYRL
ncbi:DUF1801 domain-containing protein [Octadecabacter sp. CECT 8868]|uniref:DUF1801 domain-containing protein n=1 Tax=Octadecabacter algicola TaxID=2909342 RepID=UPI001F1D18DE|nr:DUF1801 domain-containing protein [Octadecabacter algicola]MCF2905120.1 DUF1801 domain-containing protein [Octadecabacter algicola]